MRDTCCNLKFKSYKDVTFTKGCEMKEFIIDACKWYLYEDMDDSSKSDAVKNFKYLFE